MESRIDTDWRVRLEAASRPSEIVGGWGALDRLPARAEDVARSGARIFVVSDRTVWARWGEEILSSLSHGDAVPIVRLLEPGEAAKTVITAAECWDWLAARGARREDVVVAAGGGVVGDLAGFVAATYLRGVRFWQIPTTLLSQVDSSVGGKVGVNLSGGKNLVGAFYQPEAVVSDQRLLVTLPPEDFVSGLGEVVKYALLSGESFLRELEQGAANVVSRSPAALSAVVERCVRLKVEIVREDERDVGRRAILNLGHTVAHALEHAAGFGNLSHGAAVGLGLLVALSVSESVCGLAPTLLPRVRELLSRLGLPISIEGIEVDAILSAARGDKKMTSGGLGFVCLQATGEPLWSVRVEEGVLARHLEVILS